MKKFTAEAATKLVATVSIPECEKDALGITVRELANKFQVEHPEYAQCTMTFEYLEKDIILSFTVIVEGELYTRFICD